MKKVNLKYSKLKEQFKTWFKKTKLSPLEVSTRKKGDKLAENKEPSVEKGNQKIERETARNRFEQITIRLKSFFSSNIGLPFVVKTTIQLLGITVFYFFAILPNTPEIQLAKSNKRMAVALDSNTDSLNQLSHRYDKLSNITESLQQDLIGLQNELQENRETSENNNTQISMVKEEVSYLVDERKKSNLISLGNIVVTVIITLLGGGGALAIFKS